MFSCQLTNFFYDINKKVFVLYLRLWCWRKITPAEEDAWFRCCGSLSLDSHDSSEINSRFFNLNSLRVENFISSPVRQPLIQNQYSRLISASKRIAFILNYNLVDLRFTESETRLPRSLKPPVTSDFLLWTTIYQTRRGVSIVVLLAFESHEKLSAWCAALRCRRGVPHVPAINRSQLSRMNDFQLVYY